ncbi:MAG: CpsD/CapB family tyrosine-protein kinase [Candidatus Scalindua sp.]|nr:CpsD/CapB family tyrosine-protein kinase [Candidatus Scalindua sp.]
MSKIEKALKKTKNEVKKDKEVIESVSIIERASKIVNPAAITRNKDDSVLAGSIINNHQNRSDSQLPNHEENSAIDSEKKEIEATTLHNLLADQEKSETLLSRNPKTNTQEREISDDQKTGYVDEHIVAYYDFLGKQTWDGPVMVNFRRLQVSLKDMLKTGRSKVLVIASAVQNEGKSITAVNIAISLCKNNTRVVLVDCDIRNPSVHKLLGFVPDKGLSDYLGGETGIGNCSYNGIIPGLTVIPAGSKTPDVCELLESKKNKQLVSYLKEHFDYVIIDTPPILSFPDASVLSPLSDGVVLVINCKITKKSITKRAVETLHDCRIIGCVMNESEMQGHSHYQYY